MMKLRVTNVTVESFASKAEHWHRLVMDAVFRLLGVVTSAAMYNTNPVEQTAAGKASPPLDAPHIAPPGPLAGAGPAVAEPCDPSCQLSDWRIGGEEPGAAVVEFAYVIHTAECPTAGPMKHAS